jgi:ribosomal protein L22
MSPRKRDPRPAEGAPAEEEVVEAPPAEGAASEDEVVQAPPAEGASAEDEPPAQAASLDSPPEDRASEGDGEEPEAAEAPDAAEAPRVPPAAPAQAPRRARREPGLAPPVVRAHAKYVHSSARKARLVCDHIRGKTVEEARAILAHTPRAVARDWSKLLESAVANAEHNHELVGEDLYVKSVHADEGPTIKRFRPRARGRADRIRKRTSHLTILLTPRKS